MKRLLNLTLLMFSLHAVAEDGWFKKRLKDRWIKKQSEISAPIASRDHTTPISRPGTYTYVMTFQNQDRYYKIHLPKSFDPKKSIPLVFAFHGGTGNMEVQSHDKFYKLISKAEREGFAIVFPNGYSRFKSGKIATWNAGLCCGEAKEKAIDDVGFVREIFSKIKLQLKIDLQTVFAIGMSNGAMMSYRLACEASDIFKAIGVVAGTDHTILCNPKKPVSILHIHAMNDDHVKYTGGRGKKVISASMVPEFASVESTLSKWKNLLKCSGDFKITHPKKGLEIQELKNCQQNSQIKHIKLSDGGHSWPGGVSPRGGGDKASMLISANDEIWNFFQGLP
jgi:polyhydroxybutyrate depolymerase